MSTADRSHHRESSEQAERNISEDQRDNTILNIMLCGPSYPWTVDELVREVQDADAADAVARLTEAGLVHRFGEFVFPTRSSSPGGRTPSRRHIAAEMSDARQDGTSPFEDNHIGDA